MNKWILIPILLLIFLYLWTIYIVIPLAEYLKGIESQNRYNVEFESCSDFSNMYVIYQEETHTQYWVWYNVCNLKVTLLPNN